MGHTGLTVEQKAYFENLLKGILNELFEEGLTTVRGGDYLEDKTSDLVDQASVEIDSTLNFRIRERGGHLAAKIKEALAKLEDGTFGICEECGKPISDRRLRARPIASLCITCKEKQEHEEKIRGT